MVETLLAQLVVKSSVSDFWNGLMDYVNLFPKVAPESYKNVEILEGDGTSVGSVYVVHFYEDSHLPTSVKIKVVALDIANKKATYEVIDGNLMKYYKTYKMVIEMTPKEDGEGSIVNWLYEFEKKSPQSPIDPTLESDSSIEIFAKVDAYLLKNA